MLHKSEFNDSSKPEKIIGLLGLCKNYGKHYDAKSIRPVFNSVFESSPGMAIATATGYRLSDGSKINDSLVELGAIYGDRKTYLHVGTDIRHDFKEKDLKSELASIENFLTNHPRTKLILHSPSLELTDRVIGFLTSIETQLGEKIQGIATHDLKILKNYHKHLSDLMFVFAPLNPLNWHQMYDLRDYCHKESLNLTARSILSRGLLVEKGWNVSTPKTDTMRSRYWENQDSLKKLRNQTQARERILEFKQNSKLYRESLEDFILATYLSIESLHGVLFGGSSKDQIIRNISNQNRLDDIELSSFLTQSQNWQASSI